MADLEQFINELSDLATEDPSYAQGFEGRETESISVENGQRKKKVRASAKSEPVETLEAKIEELKHENQALRDRVDELTAQKDLNALRYQVMDLQETIDQLRKDKLALETIQRNQAKQLLESDVSRSYGCIEEGFTREILAMKHKVKLQQKRIDHLQRETISKSNLVHKLRKRNKELEVVIQQEGFSMISPQNREQQEGRQSERIKRLEEEEGGEDKKEGEDVHKLQKAFQSLRKRHHHAVRSLDRRLETMQREHEQRIEKMACKTQEVSRKHQEEGLRKMRGILNHFLKKQQQRGTERLSTPKNSSRSRTSSPFTPTPIQSPSSAFDAFSLVPSTETRTEMRRETRTEMRREMRTETAETTAYEDDFEDEDEDRTVSRESRPSVTPRPPSSPPPSNLHEKRKNREEKREQAKQAFLLSSKSP